MVDSNGNIILAYQSIANKQIEAMFQRGNFAMDYIKSKQLINLYLQKIERNHTNTYKWYRFKHTISN